MSFKTDVEAITGLTLDSDGNTRCTGFLKEGVLDVTNRHISLKPQDASQYQRASSEQTAQGLDLNSATILSVVRESGTDNDWRACRPITVDVQSRVTDINSIHYASKYNPAFLIHDDGKLYVYPEPSSNPDAYKVYYVNNDPVDGAGNSLTYDDISIGYFPLDKVYLVTIYAGIKELDYLAGSKHVMPTIPTDIAEPVLPNTLADANIGVDFVEPIWEELSLSSIPDMNLPEAPVAPSIDTISVGSFGSAPAYNKPTLNLDAAPTINDLTITAIPPVAPTLSSTSISFSESAPTYIPPVLNTPDYADVNTWINTEEDPEMAASRLQDIQVKISQFQAEVQNSVQSFTEQSTEYTTKFQEATQNAQLSSKDEDQSIQLYVQQLQEYQVSVNKEVQQFTNNMNKDIKLWESKRLSDVQEFTSKVQDELNEFNSQNAAYQTDFQKAVQDAQLGESEEARKLQQYGQDIQNYSAQVNKEIQRWQTEEFTKVFNEWSTRYQGNLAKYTQDIQKEVARINSNIQKFQVETGYDTSVYTLDIQKAIQTYQQDVANYSAKIQKYGAQVQKVKMDIDLYQQKSLKLQKQYDNAFLMMAPKQMQQQQQPARRRRRR